MDKKSRELVMAKLYFKNKDYKMAEKSFNEYLSMNPEDVAALKLMAQVYEQNKRFDKAFEMYERCYLAEPDRTGVLLDISRILLMNEIWLEQVDYRKWLNLAIKAFPTNPITVHCKAFLSTLPAGGQSSSPQRDVSSRPTYKSPGEDPLFKILEKIEKIENKLENIEIKLNNLDLSNNQNKTATASNGSFSFFKPIEKDASPQKLTTVTPTTTPTVTPTVTPIATPIAQKQSPMMSKLPENNKTATTPAPPLLAFGSSMMSASPAQFAPVLPTTSAAPSTSFQSPSSLSFSLNNPLANMLKNTSLDNKSASPFSVNNSIFGQTINNLNNPSPLTSNTTNAKEVPATTTDQPFTTSGNLFANSIQKFNIRESPWNKQNNFSFTLPEQKKDDKEVHGGGDNDEGAENDEVVQNEELPIENTCDMTPIEIKTGEEDEDKVFEHRCKLFRFRDKEFKERGLGNIKVLRHKSTGKGRLIMRREAIGLVCLNCWDCHKIERVRETQVKFGGIDASDGQPEPTVFLVKFKTQELTDDFMSHLTSLFSDKPSSTNTSIAQSPKLDKTETSSNNEKSEIELVDPQLDQSLVDKARELKLPDLFYHKLKNQEPCSGCDGCEDGDE